jgi:acetyl esterase/lipase
MKPRVRPDSVVARHALVGRATILALTLLLPTLTTAQAPAERPGKEPDHPASIPLWANGAPGFEDKRDEKEVVVENGSGQSTWISLSNVHNPTITPYLPTPDKATGIAVVVAPGGGHRVLAMSHEGYDVGQWLADHGIAAFVLKYRLERGTTGARYSYQKEALADIQRAIRTIRGRAAEWHIKPDAIGVMGFSAGGEMAALAAKKYDDGQPDATDPIDRVSSKPAFQALIYPGKSYLIVPDKNSPPAFLACSFDDRRDIAAGLAEVYLRFHDAGVPAELHIFSSGGHGFGIRPSVTGRPVNDWPMRFVAWLDERGFAKAKPQ